MRAQALMPLSRMAGGLAHTHTVILQNLKAIKPANFTSSLIAKPTEDLLFLFGG